LASESRKLDWVFYWYVWPVVNEAVTVERLVENMVLELAELFPRQSDLRLQAVRLLMHLEESGPRSQTELADENWIGSLGALAGWGLGLRLISFL